MVIGEQGLAALALGKFEELYEIWGGIWNWTNVAKDFLKEVFDNSIIFKYYPGQFLVDRSVRFLCCIPLWRSLFRIKGVRETKHFAPQGGSVSQSSARQIGPQEGHFLDPKNPPEVVFGDFRRFLTDFGRFCGFSSILVDLSLLDFGAVFECIFCTVFPFAINWTGFGF